MSTLVLSNKILLNQSPPKILAKAACFALLFSSICSHNFVIDNKIMAIEHISKNNVDIGAIKEKDKYWRDDPPPTPRDLDAEKARWLAGINTRYKGARPSYIQEGIVHLTLLKYLNGRPVKINIVEVNRHLNPQIEIAPQLASSTNLAQKATIKTIANNTNSIIAINGTYFKPQNGIPLGTLVIDKKILTGPIYNRVALCVSKDGFAMGRFELNASLKSKDKVLKIDNINQPRMLSTYTLVYTRDWGKFSPQTPQYGAQLVIENNKITKISDTSVEIPQNGYVIVGSKSNLEPFFGAKDVKVDIKTSPDLENADHIISGGPYLVRDGAIFIDTAEQKLNAVEGKNPRTAVGYTAEGNLILVTVDGREQASVGMTLTELARLMKDIGCINAMNLDGGGSSVMYVNGNIVNSPAVKGGIAISNAFTVSINEKLAAVGK